MSETSSAVSAPRWLSKDVMAGLDPAISSHVNGRRTVRKHAGRLGLHRHQQTARNAYVGVTSDLSRRIWEHREGVVEGFTSRYRLKRLVYAEFHDDIRIAIQREHNIKHWPRAWKVDLIQDRNGSWIDLFDQLPV